MKREKKGEGSQEGSFLFLKSREGRRSPENFFSKTLSRGGKFDLYRVGKKKKGNEESTQASEKGSGRAVAYLGERGSFN